MSDVYEEAFHHLVWATKQREPMIVPRMESLLYTYIRQKCREMKTFVHAVIWFARSPPAFPFPHSSMA